MGGCVLTEHVNVSLFDPDLLQGCNAAVNKKRPDVLSAEIRRDGKVMQIASPAVVAGHDAADDVRTGTRDEAEAGVSQKVTLGRFGRIGRPEANSFDGIQERPH